jgi:hypothetical protein
MLSNPQGLVLPEGSGKFPTFSIYIILRATEYKMQKNNFLGSKVRPVRRADNLTAICELIVYTM